MRKIAMEEEESLISIDQGKDKERMDKSPLRTSSGGTKNKSDPRNKSASSKELSKVGSFKDLASKVRYNSIH